MELHFYRAYETASYVQRWIEAEDGLGEMHWQDSDVIKCLVDYKKVCLLHHYINTVIQLQFRHDYHHDYDMMERHHIDEIEKGFETYNVQYESFDDYVARNDLPENEEDIGENFAKWFDEQDGSAFMSLWEKITDEVFHILFADRKTLLAFHKYLAEYLQENDIVPTEYLTEKGLLKRKSPFPVWLKKAVYLRDHGRCVLCSKDLTGLIATDGKVHYDHMVPLYLWGTNDSSNIQLLCDACNLSKSGKPGETSVIYPTWWE